MYSLSGAFLTKLRRNFFLHDPVQLALLLVPELKLPPPLCLWLEGLVIFMRMCHQIGNVAIAIGR